MTLDCFKCGRKLKSVFPDDIAISPYTTPNQPYDAATFQAYGQYGSTVYDPMSQRYPWLEINICDKCLIEGKDQILEGTKVGRPKLRYEKWNPFKEVDS
jgi:hypothetical protein